MKKSCAFVVFLLAAVSAARAFDRPGHSVTAAIACHDLELHHPEILPKLTAILQASEDYHAKLNWAGSIAQATLPADGRREGLMLMMLAARWPDDIKSDGTLRDKRPHQTHPWHYIDLPYSLDGTPTKPAGKSNIETAFANFQAEWATGTDGARKAQLISWFEHLIGDSHQPLHSATAFGVNFQNGDGGGGQWRIHRAAGASTLHSFWDDVVIGADQNSAAVVAGEVDQVAARLAHEHPRNSFPQLQANRTLKAWIERETFPLAVHQAYRDGQLPLPVTGFPTRLTDDYVRDARTIAESQMALAGYRMADFLYELLK